MDSSKRSRTITDLLSREEELTGPAGYRQYSRYRLHGPSMEYKNIGCGRRRFFNLFAPLLRKPSGYRRFRGGESFFPGHLGETIATQLRMYETTNTSMRIDEVHYVLAQIQQIMCCTNVQARARTYAEQCVFAYVSRGRARTQIRAAS